MSTDPGGGESAAAGLSSRARCAHLTLFAALALAVCLLDLFTKDLVFRLLEVKVAAAEPDGRPRVVHQKPVVVIRDLFDLEANINFGAFSGWFQAHTEWLAVLSVLALVVVAWFAWSHLKGPGPHRLWFTAALGLLWGGTLGNLYDRALLGYVRDFVKWFFVREGKAYVWPNFNIADSAICVGVGIILVLMLLDPLRGKEKPAPAARQGSAAGGAHA